MKNPASLPDFLVQKRLTDLEDHLTQDLNLIKSFEDALRYEDNPRTKIRYQRELVDLQASALHYQNEYDELRGVSEIMSPKLQTVANQLEEMIARLDQVQTKLEMIHGDLHYLQKTLIAHYESGERTLMEVIISRLDKNQLETVQLVLDGVEGRNQFDSEILQLTGSMSAVLEDAQRRGIALPAGKELIQVFDSPNLDVQHKLKVSIPIIPLVLSYEGEIGLGNGMNLAAAWQQLVAKVKSWNRDPL